MNVFDILGPVMIGPSSSHTAGAARIGRITLALLGAPAVKADIFLHGSFAKTYKGHGTDKALIAGIMGMATDDSRIRRAPELAKEQGLADVILNPFEQDVEQEIRNLTLGRGADAVLEVAGGRDTFQMAWKIARPNAVVCVVALYEEPQMLPLPDMYGKNLVFKTGGVDASCCEEIMKLIKAGKLDTSCLITHRAKLENIMEAYDVFENKRNHVIKYAIEVS